MADISKITTLDGQTHNIKDSTARSTANSKSTVVANPPLAGTEGVLNALQIDNVKYKLSSGLPDVTSSDNGKVLMVVNGQWAVVSLPLYNGGVT